MSFITDWEDTGVFPLQDHENVLDSDSILSLIYLPRSLTILGGGVIACEFASIFGTLGVDVTMVHADERPLSFMDPELTQRFVAAFEDSGGRLRPGRHAESVRWTMNSKYHDSGHHQTRSCTRTFSFLPNSFGRQLSIPTVGTSHRASRIMNQFLESWLAVS